MTCLVNGTASIYLYHLVEVRSRFILSLLPQPSPVHTASQRFSRRLRGLPPEFTMPGDYNTISAAPPTSGEPTQTRNTVGNRFYPYRDRDASTFSGKRGDDPIAWIHEYERVSIINGWDDSFRLANVIFYLTGTAKLWFENHEDTITSWEIFKSQLVAIFGNRDHQKKEAEAILSTRAQLSTETCTDYIENVLRLCRLVDPQMSEEDKVGHLLKGIAEDVFNFVALRNVTSVGDVVNETRNFEALRRNRIGSPAIRRLPNVVPTLAAMDHSTHGLEGLIRRIIREEMHALMGYNAPASQPADISDLVRNEVRRIATSVSPPVTPPTVAPSWGSIPQPQHNVFGQTDRPTDMHNRHAFSPIQPITEPTSPFGPGRTADNRPICYGCGRVGHVRRYCRSSAQPWNTNTGQYQHRPDRRINNDITNDQSTSTLRPSVPRPHRQSPSPPPRSFRDRSPSPAFRSRSPAGNQ